jgi:integrase
MGRKSSSGGVRSRGDRIQLDFPFQGQRCRPTLNEKPTGPNLLAARRRVADIRERIRQGTFDLEKEFPEYAGLERFGVVKPDAAKRTVRHYVEAWQTANSRLKPSTLDGYSKIFKRYWLAWFGDRDITTVMHSELAVKLGAYPWTTNKTYNNVLACGRDVWAMACKDHGDMVNPLDAESLPFLEVQRSEPDPFSLEEIELVLAAIREHWCAAGADYYEFAFFSGLRPNEQIELHWPDVDLPSNIATVRRGRVRKDVREVKNYDARVVQLHSRARAALERQPTRLKVPRAHVFLHPGTGARYIDEQSQRRHWTTAVKASGVRYREPYQTRHSYATMLLMSGANPAWAAKQMGHSPQVFLKVYAKWIEGEASRAELAKVERFSDKSGDKPGGVRRAKAEK